MSTSSENDLRSERITRNTFGLFSFRALSFVSNIALVPLSLSYLGTTFYGIWMTVGSVVTWIGIMDLGIGNGLRNRLTESLAKNDTALARKYLSSAYLSLMIVTTLATAVILVVNPYIDWVRVLNAPMAVNESLSSLTAVVFACLGLRLALGLINGLLFADQRPALVSLIDAVAALSTLVSVFLLSMTGTRSLMWFGLVSSIAAPLSSLVASIILFAGKYRAIAPKLALVRRDLAVDMLSLGAKFFILQGAAVALFASTGIIIAQLAGPDQVAIYSIALRYYGLPLTVFGIILTPYWSAYTQAFELGEMNWIANSIRRLRTYMLPLFLGLVVMFLLATPVYSVWVGSKVELPPMLSMVFIIYVLLTSWCNIHVNLVNGTGKIALQVVVSVGMIILFYPLAKVFSMWLVPESAAVMFAVCALLLIPGVLWPIQARRLLQKTARGIWSR